MRIPFARSGGPYAPGSNQDMLTVTIDGLVARFGLAGQRLGEVVAGAVLKHSRDYNLTRECVLGSRLDPHTPAYDLQQAPDQPRNAEPRTGMSMGEHAAITAEEYGITREEQDEL